MSAAVFSCGDDDAPDEPGGVVIGKPVTYTGVYAVQSETLPVQDTFKGDMVMTLTSDVKAKIECRALPLPLGASTITYDLVMNDVTRVETLEGHSYTGKSDTTIIVDGKERETHLTLTAGEDVRGYIQMTVRIDVKGYSSVSVTFRGQR